MAQYAVLNGGVVVDRREIADWDNYDPRKKEALDEKGDWMPVLRPLVPEGAGPIETLIVETDKVRQVFSYPPPTVTDVKQEAQRRIYELYPQWKQANMIARAVELLQVGQANWSPEEQAEAAALNAAWAWIKAVRAKSNEIELLNPLPEDVTHDSWWS